TRNLLAKMDQVNRGRCRVGEQQASGGHVAVSCQVKSHGTRRS
ncbi:hypothetical protein Pmani_038686, partial [Petrolisthes manimaculis]